MIRVPPDYNREKFENEVLLLIARTDKTPPSYFWSVDDVCSRSVLNYQECQILLQICHIYGVDPRKVVELSLNGCVAWSIADIIMTMRDEVNELSVDKLIAIGLRT